MNVDLREAQKAVFQNKLDKGFNVTDVNKEFCLLYGEVAEAYDAWRKKKADVGEELADIAIYLLGVSEMLGIDLAFEIERKMQINKERQYKETDGVLTKVTK
jgi:NTP pyrophosphatase (non-canonical NTP hydrolase)